MSKILIIFYLIGLQSTVPANWDRDAIRRKQILVAVNRATDYAEHKKVENLFLQTMSGGRKMSLVVRL